MNEMAIKRKYISKNAEVVELQIFADASLDAMCIVAYFRINKLESLPMW